MRDIITTWVKSGLLVLEDYINPVRHEPAKGLRVIDGKRPT
jgi:hypothetical protein